MKLMTLAVAVAATVACVHGAQARTHHHDRRHYSHEARRHAFRHDRWARRYRWRDGNEVAAMDRGGDGYGHGFHHSGGESYGHGFRHGSGYGARPRAWCGWEMRRLVSSDPGSSYNLARNWAHWGHSGPAGIGAVVVWRHHVGKIVGRENGNWVIESGNDGHRLRTRPRSIAGVIAIRWS